MWAQAFPWHGGMMGLGLLPAVSIWICSAQRACLPQAALTAEGFLVLIMSSKNNNMSIGILLSTPDDKEVYFLPAVSRAVDEQQRSAVISLVHLY